MGGGLIAHTMTDIEVSCLPKDLPESIDVDMEQIDVGQIVHLSDIKMPSGVESVSLSQGAEYDLTVATVNKQKAVDIEEALDSDEADYDNAESEKESSED